ncbi:MAG: hypothetical protein Q9191_007995 [Dirinaria sp. TL-2023a]
MALTAIISPFFHIQTSLLVQLFAALGLLALADIVRPDIRSCHHQYDVLDRPICNIALEAMPKGALPSIFSPRASIMDNAFTLPRFYVDSAERPRCVITIELDGHSNRNVFVLIPWDKIRDMAEIIMDTCIPLGGYGWGGTATFGLQRTFDALVNLAPYDREEGQLAEPAEVTQPDGSGGFVAIPADAASQGYDVPLYLLVTVSGQRYQVEKRRNDGMIGTSLREEMRRKYRDATDVHTQNNIQRIRDGLSARFISDLWANPPGFGPRWWEFTPGPPTPDPANVKYQCEARLGNPQMAHCESALIQMPPHGPVTLDAVKGPVIIRTAGTDTALLPPTFQISIYLQEPFTGAANQTCAWGVVSGLDDGDVRECPAYNGHHRRPPQRNLGDNTTTYFHYDNMTEIIQGNTLEIKSQNSTGFLQGNSTDFIADAQLFATSATGSASPEGTTQPPA